MADVINENPNLFYVTPETISYDENTQVVDSVVLNYDTDSASLYAEALQAAYDEAITDPLGMNDLQKARALHDWIVQHVSYDYTYSKYTAYDAIVNRSAVCQGYTLAYAALLEKAGIENDYCRSSAMNHMWNYVKIDGNWYHVDTTWDDPSWGSTKDDRTGYVRHTYFLNSDTQIQQAASGSSDTHHSWTKTKTCSSTTYDNAWWQDEISAIFVIDGKEYYLKLTSQSYKIQLVCRTGNTEQVLYTKNAKWYKWDSNSYYYTIYSSLSYYKGRLYFNDPLNIYVICPGDTTPTTLYTYGSGQGYIYGCLICDDGQVYDSADAAYMHVLITKNTDGLGTPNYWGYKSEWIANARITADLEELAYGYTTSAVLTAKVDQYIVGTPTYQWYKLTRNSSGVATATAISGATSATYTVPLGLSEGIHTYRVKVSMDGVTLPADYNLKVGEVKGTIANKNYATTYVYNGASITRPTSDNFTTNAGKMTFTWYSGEEKLTYTPYEAGTYRLHVTAEEIEYATAAEYDLTVTIQKRPLKVKPKDATIVYGDNLSDSFDEPIVFEGLLSDHDVNEYSYYYSTEDVTDSGKTIVEYVRIYDWFGEEVTHNYEIEYVEGNLVILPREITIKADDQKLYKGQNLVNTRVSVTSGSLPGTMNFIEATLVASTDEVTENGIITIRDVAIKSWGGDSKTSNYKDVTSNYMITTETGNLIIEEGGLGDADVYRIYGKDRYATSFQIADTLKELLGVEKFQTIIIANGENFPDALAGSYLASVKSAPIIMANKRNAEDVKQYVKDNLVKGGIIYILGGVAAVPSNIEEGLQSYGWVRRLYGSSRYDMNLCILKEAGIGTKDLIVCTGESFADSLSASATGLPIFLVKTELTDSQKEFLSNLHGNNIYIVGGTGAVSVEIEDALNAYGNVTRVYGKDRFKTSIAVANTFFDEPTAAVIAYAMKFPDGLCGGPLAYTRSVPLILTTNEKQEEAAAYVASKNIKYGAALGGSALLSNVTVKKIFHADRIVELKK